MEIKINIGLRTKAIELYDEFNEGVLVELHQLKPLILALIKSYKDLTGENINLEDK